MSDIVQIYKLISYAGYAAFAIFLILSIFLFIKFKIPKIVMDLTGITEKRAVRLIGTSGIETLHDSSDNITDKISKSGRIIKATAENLKYDTVVTSELTMEETSLLQPSREETTLLGHMAQQEETTLLYEGDQQRKFTILEDITFIHTNIILSE